MTEEDVTDLLYEFQHWESEEEEGNDLLIRFRNWVTEEEEKQEYDRIFLREYFPQLPRDVQKCIRIKVVILFRCIHLVGIYDLPVSWSFVNIRQLRRYLELRRKYALSRQATGKPT
ncbi:hypothetical protein GOP47_0009755 [Adiantum capillus-veneris]|uniref:CUT domain-containing protein n=1 Tax=Adiantum capillus-veneris TaxID=13818 RepID=A0A9D4UX74_ADICA|nr:hypothetical protein GOP47_0009755 [Adiantum capillus-veneris]